nr:immunoglobulin heavy chain junction region [Macaca mulatta]
CTGYGIATGRFDYW